MGRDWVLTRRYSSKWGFQSTRPRGARRDRFAIETIIMEVSIHAPAWGATTAWHLKYSAMQCFNPRARVGRDKYKNIFPVLYDTGFNPRARVGRDKFFCFFDFILMLVSIHAPAWGATKLLIEY